MATNKNKVTQEISPGCDLPHLSSAINMLAKTILTVIIYIIVAL